jgi:hypothetical protein
MNGTADDHANRSGQRHQSLIDDLVFFGLGLPLSQARGQVDCHGFGNESGAGVELQNAAPVVGGVSGFFQKFALGGLEFVLAGIDASRRELPEVVCGGVAVLSLEKDSRRGSRIVDGEHDDRAGVMDDVAASAHASGLLNVVGGDRERRAAVDGTRGDETDTAGLTGSFLGGFGHGNKYNGFRLSASGGRNGPRTSDLGLRTSNFRLQILDFRFLNF